MTCNAFSFWENYSPVVAEESHSASFKEATANLQHKPTHGCSEVSSIEPHGTYSQVSAYSSGSQTFSIGGSLDRLGHWLCLPTTISIFCIGQQVFHEDSIVPLAGFCGSTWSHGSEFENHHWCIELQFLEGRSSLCQILLL